jgi:hypothetical protein
MNGTSGLHVYVHAPHLLSQALARTAKRGIYLVRDVPRDLQRTARARAVRDGTTLRWVLLQALRDYATGRWTPRGGAE